MAQRPLSPVGEPTIKLAVRVLRGERNRIDQAAERRGVDRSRFVREALTKAVAEALGAEEVAEAS